MDKKELKIRELCPDDAETMIAYTKQIGGESDNLTFGADGFPVTVENEREFLQAMIDDPHSVMFGVWHGNELIADGSLNGLPRRMSHRAALAITVSKANWNQGIGSKKRKGIFLVETTKEQKFEEQKIKEQKIKNRKSRTEN